MKDYLLFYKDCIRTYEPFAEPHYFESYADLLNFYANQGDNIRVFVAGLGKLAIEMINSTDYSYQEELNPTHLKNGCYCYRFGINRNTCYFLNYKINKKRIQFQDINLLFPNAQLTSELIKYIEDNNIKSHTTGKEAFTNYKDCVASAVWNIFFPHVPDEIDKFVRNSYWTGWLYYRYDRDVIFRSKGGRTYDVNSLYASIMREEALPVGNLTYFKDVIPVNAQYYFVRISCSFELKERAFPFVRDPLTKNNLVSGKNIELTFTKDMFEMFLKYYNVDYRIIDGYSCDVWTGAFNKYIDKWFAEKVNAKGTQRDYAKLMLNSLYGKFGTKPANPHFVVETGLYEKEESPTVYVPIAAAITSKAICRCVEAAIANYDRFIFAHTDSIHLEGDEEPNGIAVDQVALGKWKLERKWQDAYFSENFNYIERDGNDYKIAFFGLRDYPREKLAQWLREGLVSYEDIHEGITLPEADGSSISFI